jgi:hypothetical protein
MPSKNLPRFSPLFAVLACLIGGGALVPVNAAGDETFNGYLVDRSCAAMFKNDHLDPTKRLKDHLKSCDLDPACSDSGYTIYSGGKWIDLDAPTSAMVQKVLRASKKDKGNMFKVTGTIKRNELHGTTVAEI